MGGHRPSLTAGGAIVATRTDGTTGVTANDITLSAGTTDVHPSDATVAVALARADEALYAAKNAGRNRTHRSG